MLVFLISMDYEFGFLVTLVFFSLFCLFLSFIAANCCCCCSVFLVMAGSAPEGTQFDARQFDQKLNDVLVFFLYFHRY